MSSETIDFKLTNIIPDEDNKKPSFVCISMFTNDEYVEQAKRLVGSLDALNLPYEVFPIESNGTWTLNAQKKPIIVREALNKYRRPIVWVDADSEVLRYPEAIDDLIDTNCLMAYTISRCKKPSSQPNKLQRGYRIKMNTAFMYFGYSDESLRLIDKWIEINNIESSPTDGDQGNLHTMFYKGEYGCWYKSLGGNSLKVKEEYQSLFDSGKIRELPQIYCVIKNGHQYELDGIPLKGEPYTSQYQASRNNCILPRI